MTEKTLTLEEAQLLLVEKYVTGRRGDKALAPELLALLKSDDWSVQPYMDFIERHDLARTEKTSYIHAQMLSGRMYDLEKLAEARPLTKEDCSFEGDGSARRDAEDDWDIRLAEQEGEVSYYLGW